MTIYRPLTIFNWYKCDCPEQAAEAEAGGRGVEACRRQGEGAGAGQQEAEQGTDCAAGAIVIVVRVLLLVDDGHKKPDIKAPFLKWMWRHRWLPAGGRARAPGGGVLGRGGGRPGEGAAASRQPGAASPAPTFHHPLTSRHSAAF